MLFSTANVIAASFSDGEGLGLMDAYDYLFTEEEHKAAKLARLTAILEK